MLVTHPPATSASILQSRTLAKRVCRGIVGLVADEFELDAAAVTSSTRGAPRAAYARQVAMYLAHVGFALGFETIGHAFGRDRTTVAHACRVVEDSRDDAGLDCRLATLEIMCAASDERLYGAPDVSI